MVDETIKQGITPVRLSYDDISFFEDRSRVIRSFLVIESLDLGVLTYKQYRFVARRTKIGNHMVHRHIEKVFREYPTLEERAGNFDSVSIPVYARLLKDGELAKMLYEMFARFPDVPPSRICIELSADILYEDVKEARERLLEVKALGCKIAICEVGDEFCPVFRLSELEFDYAFVDEFTSESLLSEDAERIAGSLVKFLHFIDVKVIAPDLTSPMQVDMARSFGFDGFGTPALVPATVAAAAEADTPTEGGDGI